jgi:CRP-like cAMP-binding protein
VASERKSRPSRTRKKDGSPSFGADEFVGEGCLLGQPKRLATALAMVESETMRVEKKENSTGSSR